MLKHSSVTDIVACVRAVAAGQNYVSLALTAYLFRQRRGGTPLRRLGFDVLTPTERQILKLVTNHKGKVATAPTHK